MIHVLIADDHSLIREGFKKILSRETDIKIIGEASNAHEVMDVLKDHHCNIIVLDITMPGKSGLEILEDIKIQYPHISVMILSMHSEEHYALRALKAGAKGYLTKEGAPNELINAIRKIDSGRMYLSQDVAEQLAYNLGGKTDKLPHETLSNREFQVMHLMASGKSISDISDELSISASTVSTYRQRVMEKLNLHSTAEIILYAVKNNLLND
jgi:two-component system invasion response regulator UvrY